MIAVLTILATFVVAIAAAWKGAHLLLDWIEREMGR